MDQCKVFNAKYLVVFITVFQLRSDSATGCMLELGIPGRRSTVGSSTLDWLSEKVIDSDFDIGKTVISMVLRYSNKRKRRQVGSYIEDDLLLISNSSQFGLRFNEPSLQHEIYLKSCPTAGQKETLHLAISDERDKRLCPDPSLTISVLATSPRFDGNSTTEAVFVDLCAVTIAVLNVSSLILNSSVACEKQWNCTANCTNDVKLFWIEEDLVLRTYTNYVDYAKSYAVEITCVEKGTDPINITSGNMRNIDVIFREYLTSCPTVTSTIVIQISNLSLGLTTSNDKYTKSFFEDTASIAALSSVGGVAAGGAIGTGVYFMTKKHCSTKKETTSGSEETGDINDRDPE